MRLNINLSSQPYQNLRRLVVRWSLALALVTVVTVGLVYIALGAVFSWRAANVQKRELQAQIANREQIKSQAQAYLDEAKNRSTRDESQFINGLIARKAFSWTDVLMDLEQMMPPGIHVTTIRPSINDNNQLELHLSVAGSRERAIELVRRMEDSPHFRNAAMVSESSEESKEGPKLQFNIVSIYIPSYDRTQPGSAAPANEPEQAKMGGQN
jgi:type IV pilus assembly protein PilN